MVKKFFYVLMALLFICAFTITTTPVFAQEEEEEVVEDVADISLEDLLNVEITTAGRQAEKIGEVPASVVVVTREDIEKYGYQDLSEILENIPGLYQIDDYQSKNFGIRGFWSSDPFRNMAVLVNDIRQADDLTSSSYLQQINIPAEAIDRIEVVRGPMSVIYGTGAFFGVINIKTNVVEEANSVGMLAAAGGSEKTYKMFARSSGKKEDFQYSFNGSYARTNGYNLPMDEIDKVGWTGLTTTEDTLENSEKYFNFSGTFKGFSFDGSFTESLKEVYIVLPPATDGTLSRNQSLRMTFGYETDLSDKVRLKAKIGYFMNRQSFDYDFLFDDFYGIQYNGATGLRAELNMFFNPSPQFNMSIGVDYHSVYEVINDFTVPALELNLIHFNLADGESMVTQAVYTQLNWKISDTFKIVAGARVEQVPEYGMIFKQGDFVNGNYSSSIATYSQTKAEFIPRLAAIWGINDKNYIKLLYGKAINRPSFFQLTDVLFVPGITPLEPETIQTFEFNYIGTLSPKFQVSLSVFHNMLEKLIFRTLFVIGGELTSYYANVGEMTTTGAELTITARPSEMFTLELNGTYQDTKDKRPEVPADIEVGYSPKFLGYVKASLFLNKDISIAVTGTYVDKMESYYDTTIPGPLGLGVDAYFLLGANLRIRNLFGTKMFLNVRASNLLDQEIRYPTTSYNNLFATEGTIGRGMSFLATLGFRFMPMPRP